MEIPGLIVMYCATNDQIAAAHGSYPTIPLIEAGEETDPASIYEAASQKPLVHLPTWVARPGDVVTDHLSEIIDAARRGDENGAVKYQTMVDHSARWLAHARQHIVELASGRARLATEFDGYSYAESVIIVGSGPSLESSLSDLANAANFSDVIVSDTAVSACLEAGVDIGVICTLDSAPSAPGSIPNAAGLLYPVLIYGPQTDPVHVARLSRAGCSCYMAPYYSGPIGRIWKTIGVEPWLTGGSVGTACYTAAVNLGAMDVWAVGMDCCYAPDGASHAKSVGLEAATQLEREIPGRDGGTVKSSQVLDHYRSWLERSAVHHADIGHHNASVGGAQINGWKNEDLSEILQR